MSIASADPCPCGLGRPYGRCCGRLHRGEASAGTAEELMRSRYVAFVVRDEGYLLRTWHPRSRPARLDLHADVRWIGLEVVATTGGGLLEQAGTVEFRASFVLPEAGPIAQVQHGHSRFVRKDGRWIYLDEVEGAGSR